MNEYTHTRQLKHSSRPSLSACFSFHAVLCIRMDVFIRSSALSASSKIESHASIKGKNRANTVH